MVQVHGASAWFQWTVQVHGASEWCKSMVQVNVIGIDIGIDIDIGIGNDIWCK